jgi:Uma2 family endonuclease
VVFTSAEQALRERPGSLDAYADPLPLVVEIWSPSTGTYDMNAKLPDYQEHGDLEIWRIQPYDRTVTSWRCRPDGSYIESIHRGGTIRPDALPGVVIDLDELFES